jgi:hypothetical protein
VAICSPFGGPACAAVAFASTAFVTGVTSGSLGAALKAGMIAGVTAVASYGIGTFTQGFDIPIEGLGKINPLNIAAHALVGCASSVASGGSCKSGALAAGISAAAAPFIDAKFPDGLHNPGNLAAGTAISATIGGLASVAGGGKFANGAVTGAFGYLFNSVTHHQYNTTSLICALSQPGCTFDNVMDALVHHPFLFPPDGVGEGRNWVPPFGYVTTTANWDTYTVTNVTQTDHFFYDGQVVHQILQKDDIVYHGHVEPGLVISTTGTGDMEGWFGVAKTGINYTGNFIGYWSGVHATIYSYWANKYWFPAVGQH